VAVIGFKSWNIHSITLTENSDIISPQQQYIMQVTVVGTLMSSPAQNRGGRAIGTPASLTTTKEVGAED